MQLLVRVVAEEPLDVNVTLMGDGADPLAVVAAIVAVAALLVTAFTAWRGERRAREAKSWSRVTWALERTTSEDEATARLGMAAFDHLSPEGSKTLTKEDRLLGVACMDAIMDEVEVVE